MGIFLAKDKEQDKFAIYSTSEDQVYYKNLSKKEVAFYFLRSKDIDELSRMVVSARTLEQASSVLKGYDEAESSIALEKYFFDGMSMYVRPVLIGENKYVFMDLVFCELWDDKVYNYDEAIQYMKDFYFDYYSERVLNMVLEDTDDKSHINLIKYNCSDYDLRPVLFSKIDELIKKEKEA